MKPMLADVWTRENPTGWWLSEKLDGVRAIWDGRTLLSRSGNPFPAPDWFLAQLGPHPLDGELWAGRGRFSTANGASKSHSDEAWRSLAYCVFDLPVSGPVEHRLAMLAAMPSTPHRRIVPHRQCEGRRDFKDTLRRLYHGGAEGFVLRRPGSYYTEGRSEDWLKVRCASNMALILPARACV